MMKKRFLHELSPDSPEQKSFNSNSNLKPASSDHSSGLLNTPTLLDANTGEPTTLQGNALEEAIRKKEVLTKHTFNVRQYDRQLVNALTGKPTTLQGEELKNAIKEKIVIKHGLFKARKRNRPAEYELDADTDAFKTLPTQLKTTPTIKPDVLYSRDTLFTLDSLQTRILEDIKKARSGNNAQENCYHLMNYVLGLFEHYFYNKEKPAKPSSSASSSIPASVVSTFSIKTENAKSTVTANFAINHGDNPLPPAKIRRLDVETNTESDILDLIGNPQRTMLESFDVLDSHLHDAIKNDPTKYVYGQIALAHQEINQPGHVLVYLAGEDKVLYIDPQFYDGKAKTGQPIFTLESLKGQYREYKSSLWFLEHGQYCHPAKTRLLPDEEFELGVNESKINSPCEWLLKNA